MLAGTFFYGQNKYQEPNGFMNLNEFVAELDDLNDGNGLAPEHVDQILAEIKDRRARGEAFDVSEYLDFDHRIARAEKRLGMPLPVDVVEFLEDSAGECCDDGMGLWRGPEALVRASECDPYDFMLADDRPELITRDDLKHMVTLTDMEGSHLLVDLREDGIGVLVISEDDVDIPLQAPTLSEFLARVGHYREDWQAALLG